MKHTPAQMRRLRRLVWNSFWYHFSPFAILGRLLTRLEDKFYRDDVTPGPVSHYFPEIGVDGQISIDCIVRAAAGADFQRTIADQQLHHGQAGVAPLRVGAVFVELDELGLRLRWVPGQFSDEAFLSPFRGMPPGQHQPDPAGNGRDHGGNAPLNEFKPVGDVHVAPKETRK